MRNYSQEAAQNSEPKYSCEVRGVSVAVHQGDAVEGLAKMLPRREYGEVCLCTQIYNNISLKLGAPKFIIIFP